MDKPYIDENRMKEIRKAIIDFKAKPYTEQDRVDDVVKAHKSAWETRKAITDAMDALKSVQAALERAADFAHLASAATDRARP